MEAGRQSAITAQIGGSGALSLGLATTFCDKLIVWASRSWRIPRLPQAPRPAAAIIGVLATPEMQLRTKIRPVRPVLNMIGR